MRGPSLGRMRPAGPKSALPRSRRQATPTRRIRGGGLDRPASGHGLDPLPLPALSGQQPALPSTISRSADERSAASTSSSDLSAPRGGSSGRLPPDAADALRLALGRGDILVSYQPVVCLVDRRPLLLEALARWSHRRRLIDPGAFVPLAEEAGLAEALAAAVAGRVAHEAAAEWARLSLGVSLNLPLEVVLRRALPTGLRRAFARSGLRSTRLSIELTETARAYDPATLRRALLRLRRAGHRVLLDDVLLNDPRQRLFGLPFAGLKLDRSVTETLPHRFAARLAVRRLVATAHARGQQVIAEGVATARLWAAARALGIDAAQGFLVGRPIPAAALGAWRDGWRRGRHGN